MTHNELSGFRLFDTISQTDIDILLGACEERILMSGETLFNEGDISDSIWLLKSGRVDICKNIRASIDRTLASLGPGEVIGEMGFIDQSLRSASALTTEPSVLLVLSRTAFMAIGQERPALAAVFYRNLSLILAERLRTTIELYRDSVAFSIEATGAGRLNLLALSEELKPVSILLSSGTVVAGHILQMDQSPAGYTIVVKDKHGKLGIIPYQAIQQITLE